ncbi:hypothetical protein DFH09DRAFT_1326116 [Mycena vulgaris]|nr:hypothetical protein DFH09DRAFT_1326116 [Mycena vulgaris]
MSCSQLLTGGGASTLTDAEDKAFKRQALESVDDGTTPDHALRCWLNIYRPPPTVVRPAGYVAGAAVRARVQERARVRRERVKRLMRLREGWNGRGVLRVRPYPAAKKPVVDFMDRAAREDEHARKERVRALMELRYGGKGGKGGKGKRL